MKGTCGGEVDRFDLRSDRLTRLWGVGKNQSMAAAVPSPDGSRVAALVSPCFPSYFNEHVEVRTAAGRITTTLGAGLPRCHALGALTWSDATHLLVTYAAATGPAYKGPDGNCTTTGDEGLVQLDATTSQRGLAGTVVPPAAGCSDADVASDGSETYLLERCGSAEYSRTDGPASLLALDSSLAITGTVSIGMCNDGDSLAVSGGRVLISPYLYCAGSQQKTRQPVELLTASSQKVLRTFVGTLPAYDGLAF